MDLGLGLASANPVSAVAKTIGGFIDHFFTDKTEAQRAKDQLATMQAKGQLEELSAPIQELMGQISINLAEAQGGGFFNAGWRPFVGWVCGLAFMFNYLVQPFAQFAVTAFHVKLDVAQLPHLDMETMMPLLLYLLGYGGYRSWEKAKGVHNLH